MPEFLSRVVGPAPNGGFDVPVRLVIAMLLGGVVTLVYRATRAADEAAPSFTMTLVLLSILIAMVTQVIGDNVARAFSLIGAGAVWSTSATIPRPTSGSMTSERRMTRSRGRR